jgi:hypothetical protein
LKAYAIYLTPDIVKYIPIKNTTVKDALKGLYNIIIPRIKVIILIMILRW